jgi:hypothetical protein
LKGQSGLEFRNSAQMYNNLHDDCIPKSPFIKFEDNQDNQDLRHGLFFGEESKESVIFVIVFGYKFIENWDQGFKEINLKQSV